jgi:hypothetical protein
VHALEVIAIRFVKAQVAAECLPHGERRRRTSGCSMRLNQPINSVRVAARDAIRQQKIQALVLREAVEPTVAIHDAGLCSRRSERLGYAPTVTERYVPCALMRAA